MHGLQISASCELKNRGRVLKNIFKKRGKLGFLPQRAQRKIAKGAKSLCADYKRRTKRKQRLLEVFAEQGGVLFAKQKKNMRAKWRFFDSAEFTLSAVERTALRMTSLFCAALRMTSLFLSKSTHYATVKLTVF